MTIHNTLRVRTRLRSAIHRVWAPKPKPLILMYHRIANDPIDYWDLAVSPDHFKEQLRVVEDTRYPLSLTKFFNKLIAGALPLNAIALTFDDGYADNLLFAKPLLERADVPATVFLATGYTDRESFWWDELEKLIFFGSCRQHFDLTVGDETIRVDFGTESPAPEDRTTPVRRLKNRRASFLRIWQALRRLDYEERVLTMANLRSIIGVHDWRTGAGRAMTSNEVRRLVADGLVTIGSHTVTHPVLAGLPAEACRREINDSKRACEELISGPVDVFAYPYGSFDTEVCETVKAAGFRSAYTTQRGPASATSDVFTLPRIHIPNFGGDAFERMLRSASALG